VLGVDLHGDLEEGLVEEGDSSLETPGHGRLVGSKAVGGVEVLDSLDELLVEGGGVGGGREIEVTCFGEWKEEEEGEEGLRNQLPADSTGAG
jgi:hypothetical protein